jgi:hypothetical protein
MSAFFEVCFERPLDVLLWLLHDVLPDISHVVFSYPSAVLSLFTIPSLGESGVSFCSIRLYCYVGWVGVL